MSLGKRAGRMNETSDGKRFRFRPIRPRTARKFAPATAPVIAWLSH